MIFPNTTDTLGVISQKQIFYGPKGVTIDTLVWKVEDDLVRGWLTLWLNLHSTSPILTLGLR